MTKEELISLAQEAMTHAYAPYSGYQVGAALLTGDGRVYQGCNIENASFTPTVCAERTAFFKALYDGVREFEAIAIVGGKAGQITGFFPPCGVCRQVMREFCRDDFLIHMGGADGAILTKPLSELLPCSFSAGEHMSADF
jgi:cytidine deaminase